ncbi:MAG: hypothetical protein JSS04_00475 [Proteobacteria bacterium]|nr:hypothetical protein [Pseudomonadota bacterium]
MIVPFRTFAVCSLAFGMLAAGYLIGPAPGATRSSPPSAPVPAPAAEAAIPASTAPALVTNRPPVPIVRPQPTSYFTPVDPASGASDDKSAAQAETPTPTTDQTSLEDADAKRAIEFDGYKNVHAVVKGDDGMWHARAMRGRTEIAVRVDASGNVSAE